MFFLTIVLADKARLEVLYDKASKQGIVSYLISDIEVASENFEAVKQWPPYLHSFEERYGISTNNIALWIVMIEHNPDMPLIEVWHRN